MESQPYRFYPNREEMRLGWGTRPAGFIVPAQFATKLRNG